MNVFRFFKLTLLTWSAVLLSCFNLASKVGNAKPLNKLETTGYKVQNYTEDATVLIDLYQHELQKTQVEEQFILDMLQDKAGNIWLSISQKGLIKYDGKTLTKFTTNEGLLNNTVIDIMQDQSGNIWFATLSGISIYNGESFVHFKEEDNIFDNSVFKMLNKDSTYQYNKVVNCMMEDFLGNIWFGAVCGASKYDGKNFTHYTVKEGLNHNNIRNICQDKSGNLYFGTGDGIAKYDGKTFTQFGKSENRIGNSCLEMLMDSSDNLWVSTIKGISKLVGESLVTFSEMTSLNNYPIYGMLQDKSGNIWFGTDEGGVFKYNGKAIRQYTKKDGLVSNCVLQIMQDQTGNLWLATDVGVSKYNGKSFSRLKI